MQISDINIQSGAAEWAKRASAGDVQAKKEGGKAEMGKTSAVQVSISANAGKSPAEALVMSRANALPEVREEKISLAKERISSGFYNTPEFSGQLADRLI
ncbi:MAG: flagellar biosynthesis anti-sigma factor FlgM [Fibromonadaceae bacterium]|jgi:anti-sigma28 factor (negative regulator of flagellin synthesis)|nr:flagellar biosynthesis anti-sigma factor FlgM [Fibromonadaceae bacterium]